MSKLLNWGKGRADCPLPNPLSLGATKGIKMKPFDLELPPTTTLEQLKKAKACQLGYRKLYRGLGGVKAYGKTTPITYLRILEINGLDDCLWALSRGDEKAVMIMRWWAILCSERAVGIYEKLVPNDHRVRICTETTKQFLQGQAAARGAAWSAARAAAEARDAARDAAKAAVAAWNAAKSAVAAWNAAWSAAGSAAWARDAARDAAKAAAWDAAWDAAGDAAEAKAAAWGAAWDAAWDAEREWQINLLKEFLS